MKIFFQMVGKYLDFINLIFREKVYEILHKATQIAELIVIIYV